MNCYYCGTSKDTRPYGPGGAGVCFPCATETPEREEAAQRAFATQMDAAVAMSPLSALVLQLGRGGPEPLMPGDLPPELEQLIETLRTEQGAGDGRMDDL